VGYDKLLCHERQTQVQPSPLQLNSVGQDGIIWNSIGEMATDTIIIQYIVYWYEIVCVIIRKLNF